MSDEFRQRLQQLHFDLVEQGRRVEAVAERAFVAIFDSDQDQATSVIESDDDIDRADVQIERSAVRLLALGETNPAQLRLALTVVKVNNEIERIADLAVDIAEQMASTFRLHDRLPATLRVISNSVIGMIRDANRAMQDLDVELARAVLKRHHLVEEFRAKLLREAQQQLVDGRVDVDFIMAVWTIAAASERMADHATNICEQVIYVETGQIVRHGLEGWSEPRAI